MVRHIVMFKFLEEAGGRDKAENLRLTAEKLTALQGTVPTLKASEVRLNSSSAPADNFDLVLIADFDSWEDLRSYTVHPLHAAVGAFMKDLRESRACVDFEI